MVWMGVPAALSNRLWARLRARNAVSSFMVFSKSARCSSLKGCTYLTIITSSGRGEYATQSGLTLMRYCISIVSKNFWSGTYRKANAETLVVVLIEEMEAVNNLQDILTVDQIDVFFVAPSDLAQTMGYTGQPNHPEVLAVVDRCLAQIVAAGKVPGHLGNEDTVESYMEKGVRFFLTSWQPWVARGASQYLSKVVAK